MSQFLLPTITPDSVMEKLVQQALERLMDNRSVIAIAHRLSTIEHTDNVVVLEEGEVVEQGPYDELLARRGQLWEYHSIQYQAAKQVLSPSIPLPRNTAV